MGRTRSADAFQPGTEGEFSEDDPSLVLTLARGLVVLNCFDVTRPQLSNKDLVDLTGLSKPTVSRITYTLSRFGFLRYSPALRRYSLGLALLTTAYPMLAHMKIRQVARPLMQQMANEVGGVVSIGMQLGRKMVYVESCASASAVNPVVAGVGSKIPIYPTAMGRAYLCGLPALDRQRLLDSITPGWDSPDSKYRAQMDDALAQYAQWGFCLAIPNLVRETRSVGVPLHGVIDDQRFAFNCGMPVLRLTGNQMETDIGPRLLHLVRNVEIVMGLR